MTPRSGQSSPRYARVVMNPSMQEALTRRSKSPKVVLLYVVDPGRASRSMRVMGCSKSRSPGARTVTQCADETGDNQRAFLWFGIIPGADWRVLAGCSRKMPG